MSNYNPSRSTSVLDVPARETAPFPASPWLHFAARLFSASLDAKLAAGVSPTTSHVLTVRAQQLTTPSFRRGLADAWLDLLIEARRPRAPFDPAVPLVRTSVLAAEAQIRALAEALVAPLAMVRGVATSLATLRDGGGPLFLKGSVSLSRVIEDITVQVSPLSARA